MKVEYKVRQVTRFIITEYVDNEVTGYSRPICECDNATYAYELADRLNKCEQFPQTIITADERVRSVSGAV